jgi:hypothetical protein
MGMTTKYYVDIEGNYLGGFSGYIDRLTGEEVIALPPNGSVEVSAPPDHGWQKLDVASYQDWPRGDIVNDPMWLPLTPDQLEQLGMK